MFQKVLGDIDDQMRSDQKRPNSTYSVVGTFMNFKVRVSPFAVEFLTRLIKVNRSHGVE